MDPEYADSGFSSLEVAWRWESADLRVEAESPYPRQIFRSTPLMIDGRIYVPTELSQVAALDAASGEELWIYDPKSYEAGQPSQGNYYTRGLEYRTDGEEERLILATIGKQLVSLDPATGRPDPDFGDGGMVDLSRDLGREGTYLRSISHGQPAIVVSDTIVVGSRIFDFPLRNNNPPGHVRAFHGMPVTYMHEGRQYIVVGRWGSHREGRAGGAGAAGGRLVSWPSAAPRADARPL